MRRIILALVALSWTACNIQAADNGPFLPSSVNVYFSPKGGATEACVKEIEAASKSIYVQAYSFTSKPIVAALVAAKKRGVQVSVILDRSQKTANYSEADFLAHAGISTAIDSKHAIAHNKLMVIDAETVITGSFNFTSAAESRNAENLLVLRDAALADRYLQNWLLHQEHSESYVGR